MNDEIKEILSDLEFASGVFDYTITPDRCTFLKNYITNLQQRIEKAIEYINHLSKEPNAFGHYGIHNDCAKWLLNILNGRCDEE